MMSIRTNSHRSMEQFSQPMNPSARNTCKMLITNQDSLTSTGMTNTMQSLSLATQTLPVHNKRKPTEQPNEDSTPSRRTKKSKTNTTSQHLKKPTSKRHLTYTHAQPHTTKEGKLARLLTHITVKHSKTFPGVQEISATFRIQLVYRKTSSYAGYISAYTLSRSGIQALLAKRIKGHNPDERSMVHHNEYDHPNVEELHMMMQNIYVQSTGLSRQEFSKHAEELSQNSLHFIGEFETVPRFRGSGFAQNALQTYLSLLPTKLGYEGSVTLSPAGFRHVREAKGRSGEVVGSWHEVEKKLIKSYGKSGFEVWSESDPAYATLGGITIMGRKGWKEEEKVGEDKSLHCPSSLMLTAANLARKAEEDGEMDVMPVSSATSTPLSSPPPSTILEEMRDVMMPPHGPTPPQAQVFAPVIPEVKRLPQSQPQPQPQGPLVMAGPNGDSDSAASSANADQPGLLLKCVVQ